MIGASSRVRLNSRELSTIRIETPTIASTSPPSSQVQCSARALSSAIAGKTAGTAHRRGSARSDRAAPAQRSTSSANSGSNDVNVRRPRSVASAKPATSSSRPIAADVVSSSRPASIDQANQALRRFWPISCQECKQQQRPERPRQHQRAEFETGRAEGRDRHGQQHGEHRLLCADDGARQGR